MSPGWWRVEHVIVGLAVAAFAVAAASPGHDDHHVCRATPAGIAALAGRSLLFSCYGDSTPDASNSDLYVASGGPQLRRLTSGWAWDIQPEWSPDGSRIAFASTIHGNVDIFVMNADGSGLRQLTHDPGRDTSPAWSPDGSRIAYERIGADGSSIEVMNADGSGARQLTPGDSLDLHPAWSPDGTRIAYYSFRDGNSDIFVMNADGSGPVRLTDDPALEADPAWSPDGTRIVYSSQGGLRRSPYGDPWEGDLWVMNADGSHQTRILSGGGFQPTWSPDGGLIAFASDRGGSFSIWVVRPDGSGLVRLVTGPNAYNPSWRPGPG
jgi:Tol biopolymer transport system component